MKHLFELMTGFALWVVIESLLALVIAFIMVFFLYRNYKLRKRLIENSEYEEISKKIKIDISSVSEIHKVAFISNWLQENTRVKTKVLGICLILLTSSIYFFTTTERNYRIQKVAKSKVDSLNRLKNK